MAGITNDKTGEINIVMTNSIPETTLQGKVVVGSQTMTQPASFTFELFDCSTYMTAEKLNDIHL